MLLSCGREVGPSKDQVTTFKYFKGDTYPVYKHALITGALYNRQRICAQILKCGSQSECCDSLSLSLRKCGKTSLLQRSKHYEDKNKSRKKDEGNLSCKDVHLIERNMGTENKITK